MTKRQNQNGFVLIMVVVMIALFGLMMLVLAGMSKTMMHESSAVKIDAVKKNLTFSAIAWAKYNAPNMSIGSEPMTVQLDVNELGVSGAGCAVTFYRLSNMEIEIKISATCGTGSVKQQRKSVFKIRLDSPQY